MACFRVSFSRGLLDLVLFRMADGKEWCAPELSGGERPLRCALYHSQVEQKLHRRVPESWTTTVPLKNVVHLLSNVEQTRLKLNPQRREQGTLFLVSMEALSELLHHTPTVTAGPRPRTLLRSGVSSLRSFCARWCAQQWSATGTKKVAELEVAQVRARRCHDARCHCISVLSVSSYHAVTCACLVHPTEGSRGCGGAACSRR